MNSPNTGVWGRSKTDASRTGSGAEPSVKNFIIDDDDDVDDDDVDDDQESRSGGEIAVLPSRLEAPNKELVVVP